MKTRGMDPWKGVEPGEFASLEAYHNLHVNIANYQWEDAEGNIYPYSELTDEELTECRDYAMTQQGIDPIWYYTAFSIGRELRRRGGKE